MVLSFTGEGIPLIYSGQECANKKRLEFFEKDLIEWRCDDPLNELFRDLVQLKTDNPVLHNGAWGARAKVVENSEPQKIFSFSRHKDDNTVFVVVNLSDQTQSFQLSDGLPHGQYSKFRTNAPVTMTGKDMSLPPWGWSIYVRN